MRILFIWIILITLSSCTSPIAKVNENYGTSNTVDSLVALFKQRELPVTIHYCYETIDYDKDKTIGDIGVKYKMEGQFPFSKSTVHNQYYALISLAPTECLLPCITTIDSSGSFIDQKFLNLDGGGGSGPGYKYSASVTFSKTLSILSIDTIIEFQTDTMAAPLQGGKCYRKVRSISGKIGDHGQILLSHMSIDSSISIIDTAKFNYW